MRKNRVHTFAIKGFALIFVLGTAYQAKSQDAKTASRTVFGRNTGAEHSRPQTLTKSLRPVNRRLPDRVYYDIEQPGKSKKTMESKSEKDSCK